MYVFKFYSIPQANRSLRASAFKEPDNIPLLAGGLLKTHDVRLCINAT